MLTNSRLFVIIACIMNHFNTTPVNEPTPTPIVRRWRPDQQPQQPVSMLRKRVDQMTLDGLRATADLAARVRDGLWRSNPGYIDVLSEIRGLENKARRHGQETIVDARGYTPVRHAVEFVGPTNQSLVRTMVMFAKKDERGRTQYLPDGDASGNALALDAELFDMRMESHEHGSTATYGITTMLRADETGNFAGTYAIEEDKPRR